MVGICSICNNERVICVKSRMLCHCCYQKDWNKNNPEKCKSTNRKTKQNGRKKKIEFLASIKPLKCVRCGYNKCFKAIEFHHLDSSQKEGKKDTFARWIGDYSFERFKQKILSIDFELLCANCHREEHSKEEQ